MTRREFPPAMVPGAIVITGVEVLPCRSPGKVVATVHIILNDLVRVEKARLVRGQKGLFLSMPASKNVETGEWEPHIFLGDELHRDAELAAAEAFNEASK